jgi:hypothetical protein
MLPRSVGVETENKWLTMQNANKSQNDYRLQDGVERSKTKRSGRMTLESQMGTNMTRGAEREQYGK